MLRNLQIAAIVCSLATPALSAQEASGARPNTREGFWIGFGLGLGSTGADCTSCSNDRTSGFSGYLRMGGTISRHVLLGGETNGWLHSESGVNETLGFASFIASIYPSAAGAFFLKIGLGGMTYKAEDGADELTATAPAGSFGLGYEIRVGRSMSITPFLNSLATSPVAFKINGVSVPSGEDLSINLVQLGVGLTWH